MPFCTLHSLLHQTCGDTRGSSFENHFETCVRLCTKAAGEPVAQGCVFADAGVHRSQGGPHCQMLRVQGLPAADRRCHLTLTTRNALMNSGGLTKLFFAAAVMFSSCPCLRSALSAVNMPTQRA